jgi:hypothetical protein
LQQRDPNFGIAIFTTTTRRKTMKKNRKLVLHRETLHGLELRGVAGAALTVSLRCQTGSGTTTNGDTYGYCPNTLENCSAVNYCQTGGACTAGTPGGWGCETAPV